MLKRFQRVIRSLQGRESERRQGAERRQHPDRRHEPRVGEHIQCRRRRERRYVHRFAG